MQLRGTTVFRSDATACKVRNSHQQLPVLFRTKVARVVAPCGAEPKDRFIPGYEEAEVRCAWPWAQ